MWELLILLLRQKNAIDGSDIAELLLKDREDVHSPYAAANNGNGVAASSSEDGSTGKQDKTVIVQVRSSLILFRLHLDGMRNCIPDYEYFGTYPSSNMKSL